MDRNNQRAMERRRRNQRRGNCESPVYETIAPRHSSDDMDLEPPVTRDSQIILQAQSRSNAVERRAEKATRLIRQVETFLEENENYTIESPRLMLRMIVNRRSCRKVTRRWTSTKYKKSGKCSNE